MIIDAIPDTFYELTHRILSLEDEVQDIIRHNFAGLCDNLEICTCISIPLGEFVMYSSLTQESVIHEDLTFYLREPGENVSVRYFSSVQKELDDACVKAQRMIGALIKKEKSYPR